MKKYEKPAIEEIKIGVQQPINTSFPVEDSDDGRTGVNEYSVGRKDKDYDFDDEGW